MGPKRNSQFLFLLSIPLYILQVELEFIILFSLYINKMVMAMKSKTTVMARLCWTSIVAMLLLTSTILVTHAAAEAEAAAAKSNEEVGSGRLAEGSTKAASGCHKPGYPVPPHSHCPPSPPPHAHRLRPIPHA